VGLESEFAVVEQTLKQAMTRPVAELAAAYRGTSGEGNESSSAVNENTWARENANENEEVIWTDMSRNEGSSARRRGRGRARGPDPPNLHVHAKP
jgi:hypothetical protein